MLPNIDDSAAPTATAAEVTVGPGAARRSSSAMIAVSAATAESDLPGWSAMHDEALFDRLPLVAGFHRQPDEALEQWVGEARRRGASWLRIGTALGITRQSA